MKCTLKQNKHDVSFRCVLFDSVWTAIIRFSYTDTQRCHTQRCHTIKLSVSIMIGIF